MIPHSLDEVIIAVTALSGRVAAMDGQAPVITPDAAPEPNDYLLLIEALLTRMDQIEARPAPVAPPVQQPDPTAAEALSRVQRLEQEIQMLKDQFR